MMKHFTIKSLRCQKGQSAVEFILVSVIVFFFLLFFLSLAFTLVLTQYMDYATFMAARTYKAGHFDIGNQREKARIVFRQYLTPVLANPLVRSVSELEFVKADPNSRDYQTEGVRATYEVNLFYLPPIFAKDRIASTLTLTSESFLGRDPNNKECTEFFKSFISRLGINMKESEIGNMEDNGC